MGLAAASGQIVIGITVLVRMHWGQFWHSRVENECLYFLVFRAMAMPKLPEYLSWLK